MKKQYQLPNVQVIQFTTQELITWEDPNEEANAPSLSGFIQDW